jgi:hypothetical protein
MNDKSHSHVHLHSWSAMLPTFSAVEGHRGAEGPFCLVVLSARPTADGDCGELEIVGVSAMDEVWS